MLGPWMLDLVGLSVGSQVTCIILVLARNIWYTTYMKLHNFQIRSFATITGGRASISGRLIFSRTA